MKAARRVREEEREVANEVSGVTADCADSVNKRGVILHPSLDRGWRESGVSALQTAAVLQAQHQV